MKWHEDDVLPHIEDSIRSGECKMYAVGDKVIKKNIDMGIVTGIVYRNTFTSYVYVRWETGYRSKSSVSSVLPNTPENMKMLEDRWDKRRAKQLAHQVKG